MANVKRRGFLGLMGGAVAAGPSLAAQIAEPVSMAQATFGYGMNGGMENASSISGSTDWKSSRIAEITKFLTGDDPEIDRQRRRDRFYQEETIERHRLDGLKAVSPQHKAKMLVDGNLARQSRISRMYMESELENLLSGKF